ncbi:MAG TPA: alpha/beta hydrolase [Thermoanaerobaculia bacterium]|nr:alpha/beta hydrolase [Thermoanaerobaculia bacterium]
MRRRLRIAAHAFVIVLLTSVAGYAANPPKAAAASDGTLAPWQPAAGHTQIRLWPGNPPPHTPAVMKGVTAKGELTGHGSKMVAGRYWTWAGQVTQPTITVYSPKGKNSGAAVVVFPGGGYEVVAIDLEGTEPCEWLTAHGITCVLLKYRVPCAITGPYRECASALEDAQRAVGLVRFRAAEWHIDPNKIGVLGFSAGGHMVVAISTHFEKRAYTAVDEADKVSCRPDFAMALYPGHIAVPREKFVLNPDLHVTSRTPPTFLAQAYDDPVDPVENSLVYFAALRKAGVPGELHVYAKGGHAFGLRPTASAATQWPKLAEDWLKTIGMIAQ